MYSTQAINLQSAQKCWKKNTQGLHTPGTGDSTKRPSELHKQSFSTLHCQDALSQAEI